MISKPAFVGGFRASPQQQIFPSSLNRFTVHFLWVRPHSCSLFFFTVKKGGVAITAIVKILPKVKYASRAQHHGTYCEKIQLQRMASFKTAITRGSMNLVVVGKFACPMLERDDIFLRMREYTAPNLPARVTKSDRVAVGDCSPTWCRREEFHLPPQRCRIALNFSHFMVRMRLRRLSHSRQRRSTSR